MQERVEKGGGAKEETHRGDQPGQREDQHERPMFLGGGFPVEGTSARCGWARRGAVSSG